MRYTRYLRMEKNIAASDTGGLLERWRYGRRLLMDDKATTPNGHLRHGVAAKLIREAEEAGFKLTEQELQRRLKCASTYLTEAEIRECTHGFANWDELARAGFPQVEAPVEEEPYDPRDADEKWRDFHNELKRREQENPEQGELDLDLPAHFSHDTYSPRTPLSTLVAACDESERYTDNMRKKDAERRAYVDELVTAAEGDLEMTWLEAEARRRGLDSLGLSSWDEFKEIIGDFQIRGELDDGEDADEE